MSDQGDDDQFTDEEAARRRDTVVRQMVKTPPKPHKPKTKPLKPHDRKDGKRT